jgi:uncharacterized protein (TIGR02145 family)
MKKIILSVIVSAATAAAVFLCVGCNDIGVKGNDEDVSPANVYLDRFLETFTDKRDRTVYRKVKIGKQTWMAENLNYDTLDGEGSWCYNNDTLNCNKYGRLYDWATAMNLDTSYNVNKWDTSGNNVNHRGICPSGWHLPSDKDWETLMNFTGGTSKKAGKALKAKSDWDEPGDDAFQFSALPGGKVSRNYLDKERPAVFAEAGKFGYWWTTGECSLPYCAQYWLINDSGGLEDNYYYYDKIDAFSVRCIKDD